MKKILILILLLCFSGKAHAQLPELGWSKEHVEKFMEGKYKYKVSDTNNTKYGGSISYRYAPVSLYGIDGSLWIAFDTINKVGMVSWDHGDMREMGDIGWSDSMLWDLLNSQLTDTQFLNLADSLMKKLGTPKITRAEDFLSLSELQNLKKTKPWAHYKWAVKNQEYLLSLTPHGSITFMNFIPYDRNK